MSLSFPSLYEGLPIVAVEAQAANLKLVMSTEVSIHTKLSENVVFVDLQDDMAVWSQVILDSPFGNKPLADLEAYDMNNTAEMLEKIYSNPENDNEQQVTDFSRFEVLLQG